MDKKYTADDMRKMANIVINDVYGNDFGGACYNADSKYDECEVASMLRQAADMMDAKKKYEYAEMYSNGDVSHEKGDSIDDVNHFLSDGSIIVRREVGEWEDVSND